MAQAQSIVHRATYRTIGHSFSKFKNSLQFPADQSSMARFFSSAPLVALWLLFPSNGSALFRCSERCGLFAKVMHSGTANTKDCEESCVWFVFLNSDLSCGGCGEGGSEKVPPPPTPRPVASPGAPPSPNQTPVAPAPTQLSTPSAYNIQLDLAGLPSADAAIFSAAADRWMTVIVGDLPGTVSTAGFRTISNCIYPATIDDLYICARYTSIDGTSGVLGSAGPEYTRNSDGLPVVGSMEFDTADTPSMKASGELIDTILHEMGHVLGKSWIDLGL
jgi:hypothetical protein